MPTIRVYYTCKQWLIYTNRVYSSTLCDNAVWWRWWLRCGSSHSRRLKWVGRYVTATTATTTQGVDGRRGRCKLLFYGWLCRKEFIVYRKYNKWEMKKCGCCSQRDQRMYKKMRETIESCSMFMFINNVYYVRWKAMSFFLNFKLVGSSRYFATRASS